MSCARARADVLAGVEGEKLHDTGEDVNWVFEASPRFFRRIRLTLLYISAGGWVISRGGNEGARENGFLNVAAGMRGKLGIRERYIIYIYFGNRGM